MEPTSREDLSALMDGELGPEPTRFLLRRLEHDPGLSATWSRWHLIRACLASDSARMSTQKADNDFATHIAAAIGHGHVAPTRQRHWGRYMGGGAIAAGVAVAALLLNVPNPRGGEPSPVAQRAIQAPSSATATALAEATPATSPNQVAPPWLMARQPTVLSVQPASANIVYGAGLMQPDYLRRAAFARDAMLPDAPSFQTGQPGAPFSIVLLPEAPPSSAAAARH